MRMGQGVRTGLGHEAKTQFSSYIKSCQIGYMLKISLLNCCLICAGFRTASVVETKNKYCLYGHFLPIREKHLMEYLSSDWSIIAKSSCLSSSE